MAINHNLTDMSNISISYCNQFSWKLQDFFEKADTVSASDDSITVDGKEIKIYAEPDANNCPWGKLHTLKGEQAS